MTGERQAGDADHRQERRRHAQHPPSTHGAQVGQDVHVRGCRPAGSSQRSQPSDGCCEEENLRGMASSSQESERTPIALPHHELGNVPTASSRSRECSHYLTKSSGILAEPIACILLSCIPLSCEKRTMTTLILEKRATAVSVRGISNGRTKRRRRTLTWQGLRSQGCMG